MSEYYFLAASLPELQIGYPPEINFNQFVFLMKMNLSKEDQEKAEVMRRYYDIQNIRLFWKKEEEVELDHRGNMDEHELEEALLTQSGLPDYIYTFMDKYDSTESRLSHFPQLVSWYYRFELERATGFLKEYLAFEREWRLVFTGFRAKKLGRDLLEEMQFEDPNDDLVAQILAQKDATTYEPPSKYTHLKALFEEHFSEPLQMHQALCAYRFEAIQKFYGIHLFSIDRILAFLAQIILVEKWLELDKRKGIEKVDQILEGTA